MRIRLVLIGALASATIGFAQAPSGNPGGGAAGRGSSPQGAPQPVMVPARGSASVRVPTWRQLRTAVGSLMEWQVGVSLGSFRGDTFMDAARKAEALDLAVFEGDSAQKVSLQIPKNLDYRLAPGERNGVRERMFALNVRMPVYLMEAVSEDEAIRPKQFEFAKALGVETIAVERIPQSLPAIEKLADEYGVNLALSGPPKLLLEAFQGRGRGSGAYADLGKWAQQGVAPAEGISLVGDRLMAIRVADRSTFPAIVNELNRRSLKPAITVVASGSPDAAVDLRQSLEAFERAVQPIVSERVMQLSRTIPIKGADRLTPEERERVAAATPKTAAVKPKAARRLLVYDANIGYGGATAAIAPFLPATWPSNSSPRRPAHTSRCSATTSKISNTTACGSSTRCS